MSKVKVVGKGNISAEIIADSVSSVNGQRITTFVLEYHRYIHGEVLVHRIFSRNSSSSRAIPVERMIKQVRENPAIPIHWGKKQSGMQAFEECNNSVLSWTDYEYDSCSREDAWEGAVYWAVDSAEKFSDAGYHKQIVNRLVEPFQMIRVLVTATSFDNFFWLRNHKDAQPEIQELARCMLAAYKRSKPFELKPGEWHVPFVYTERYEDSLKYYQQDTDGQMFFISAAEALKISASCSAQISYRKSDDSLEKAESVWGRLLGGDRAHSSVFEHQATPMEEVEWNYNYSGCDMTDTPKGYTHVDKENNFWSNNFKGWIQHRALIEGNVCENYDYTQEENEEGLTITFEEQT